MLIKKVDKMLKVFPSKFQAKVEFVEYAKYNIVSLIWDFMVAT